MKKGFTLIETMLAVSISLFILLCGIKFLSIYTRVYKITRDRYLQEFYINEAFIFIEEKIKEAEQIQIYTDNRGEKSIQLKLKDKEDCNYIRKKGDKLIISYHRINPSNNNNITLDLEKFNIEEVNNLIYVTIKNKRGKEYTRCFYIKKEKDI